MAEDERSRRLEPGIRAAGARLPAVRVALPFLLRRLRASLASRPGAAPVVAFDAAALERGPSATWIGHATFYVRLGAAAFLTDPMYSTFASPLRFAGPRRLVPPGVPLDALPRVDFAVVSHDHYDHADLPTLRRLARGGVPFVVPLGMGDLVRRAGGRVAAELDWWEEAAIAGLTVTCVPARHFSGRGFTDRNRRLFAGFVVADESRRFYHAGDTALFDGFGEIARRAGPIDLACLPVGAYEPRAIMAPIHLNPEEAVRAAQETRTRDVIAMHFGTFDLSDEPLDEPPRRFLAEARARGLGERAVVLAIGETRPF